jgi:hypothetical protein
MNFAPNPPPTSGVTTRTRFSSRPSIDMMKNRASGASYEESQTVSRSSIESKLARTPRHSIEWAPPRCCLSDSESIAAELPALRRHRGSFAGNRSTGCPFGDMHIRAARRDRITAIRNGRQRIDVDFDQFRGVLGHITIVREDHRNRFTDETHFFVCKNERPTSCGSKLLGNCSGKRSAVSTLRRSASVYTACTPGSLCAA